MAFKPTQVKTKLPTDNVTYKAPTTKPAEYSAPEYSSQYQGQIDSALQKVTNPTEFSYDPLQDANYQALAKIYNANGERAAKNTLGDAAALNGGRGTSYAVAAAQQTRNDYNQQLAAMIPEMEERAYGRYKDAYDRDVTALNALRDADDTAYGRHRDTVADAQWKYGMDYQKYRDDVGDAQWKYGVDYEKFRDKMSDYQWGTSFNEGSRETAHQMNVEDKYRAKEWAETLKNNAVSRANTKANTEYTKKQSKLLGKGSSSSSKKKKSKKSSKKKSTNKGGGNRGNNSGGGGGNKSQSWIDKVANNASKKAAAKKKK